MEQTLGAERLAEDERRPGLPRLAAEGLHAAIEQGVAVGEEHHRHLEAAAQPIQQREHRSGGGAFGQGPARGVFYARGGFGTTRLANHHPVRAGTQGGPDQGGQDSKIIGQFVESCSARGVAGPDPGTGTGPYTIQLYKDTGRVGS